VNNVVVYIIGQILEDDFRVCNAIGVAYLARLIMKATRQCLGDNLSQAPGVSLVTFQNADNLTSAI
jgi:hypothetical protein